MVLDILKKNFYRINKIATLLILLVCLPPLYSNRPIENRPKEHISFSLIYETFRSLKLEKAVLYYSPSKDFVKLDSVAIDIPKNAIYIDSIAVRPRWKYQVHLMLKLSFSDTDRVSNTFRYSQDKPEWEVFVGDTALRILPKPMGNLQNNQSSLKGIALIVQAAFEMILAFMVSRIFGWPPLIILMVLVANIAAFPLYMLNIQGVLLKEMLVFLVKGIVMWLVGVRKLVFYKILLTAIFVTILGLGFKQILFFIIQLL